jgi:hypothetical protein
MDIIIDNYNFDRILDEIKPHLKHAKIYKCKINEIQLDNIKWNDLLHYVYYIINDKEFILKNHHKSIIIKDKKIKLNGYKYNEKLDCSIHCVNVGIILKEVLNLLLLKNFDLELQINFKDDKKLTLFINKTKEKQNILLILFLFYSTFFILFLYIKN